MQTIKQQVTAIVRVMVVVVVVIVVVPEVAVATHRPDRRHRRRFQPPQVRLVLRQIHWPVQYHWLSCCQSRVHSMHWQVWVLWVVCRIYLGVWPIWGHRYRPRGCIGQRPLHRVSGHQIPVGPVDQRRRVTGTNLIPTREWTIRILNFIFNLQYIFFNFSFAV